MVDELKLKIRQYDPSDEEEWIKCHFLSYYDSSYLDELLNMKPRYEGLVIQLVATVDEKIVGILDIEIEQEAGQFCSDETSRCGMISVIGVIPQFRRKGIASKLLKKAMEEQIREYNIHRLEIWIREDFRTFRWLQKNGFHEFHRFFEISLSTDFFEKYGFVFPYDIRPVQMTGYIEPKNFNKLAHEHAPEKSYTITGFKKKF